MKVDRDPEIIIENDQQKIKALKDGSIDQLSRFQWIYAFIMKLILLFGILYATLLFEWLVSENPPDVSFANYGIWILDIFITIVMGLHMLYFLYIARTRYFAKEFTMLEEFSNFNYLKQHAVYVVYIIVKFFPDIYFFNTDGSFWITNFILIPILGIMWGVEYYFHVTQDVLTLD